MEETLCKLLILSIKTHYIVLLNQIRISDSFKNVCCLIINLQINKCVFLYK